MATTLGVSDLLNVQFEPHKKNLFILAIEGVDSFLVKTASKPTITAEEIAIPYMGNTRYIAGRSTFGTMTVTLHDAIAPSTSQQIVEWQRSCHEFVSGRGGYSAFYKRSIQIKLVDPVGTIVSLWDIKGAWITEASFGDLAYEGSETAEISLTLRFDNAVLQY